jgi:predicted nucleic acid-binding protein
MAGTHIVLDPSVVIKWYIPEDASKTAGELKEWILGGAHRMMVPTLFFDEIANILWKKETLRKEFLPRAAKEIIWEVLRLPLHVYWDRHELHPKALEIAGKTRISVYDAIYLTTAVQNQALFITADDRLARQLAGTSFADSLIPLKEWKKLLDLQ